MLRVAAARWPDRVALVDDHGPLTYRALVASADSAAAAFHQAYSAGPDDRIGIMCRNGRDFVISLFAAGRLGADVVLLNTDFRDAALAATIRDQRLSLLVTTSEFSASAEATGVPVADPGMRSARIRLPEVRREGRLILLTSGTTGSPRGVPRDPAVGALLGMVTTVLDRTGLRCGARSVIAVPMFHAFGLAAVGLSLALGGTAITRSRFEPTAIAELCRQHRADSLTVVPAMLQRILDADLPADTMLPRVVISGGSALHPAIARRFAGRFGDVLFNGYGSSEVALATLAVPADLRRRPGTVGRAVAGVRIAVLDDEGRCLPAGAAGRVFVGGASSVSEYVGGDTKDVVDGLVSTGDIGVLDGSGLLEIIGREDDMIVSGGENVYPQALENVLTVHEDVLDVCAVGLPDDRFGQRLVALVVPRTPLDIDGLHSYIAARASRYERPRGIFVVDEIPRNPAGKVDRAVARELAMREVL
ncbi:AMP-binding protein [Gordonia sihwensis]|uniref:AMP-binding protein n=1 Tax=Gordonia sihwensis TaxID=173559 RepID=UPI001E3BA38E|nr:AMP-binding protein [Gordonia sihwensis]